MLNGGQIKEGVEFVEQLIGVEKIVEQMAFWTENS
jgi:hypothetical protein